MTLTKQNDLEADCILRLKAIGMVEDEINKNIVEVKEFSKKTRGNYSDMLEMFVKLQEGEI